MKKIILTLVTCILLVSCKKNILDITPTDRISESTIWSDPNLPQLFINAQYNSLQDGLTYEIQYFGDDSYSQYDLGTYQVVGTGALNPSNVNSLSPFYYYWNTGYKAIANFNIFFEKIDGVPASAEAKEKMIAEVKFLRAFVYAKLIWNYGGVPIITKPFSLNETLTGVKRNTYDECINYIIKDLDDAIAALPNQQTGGNLGRASADAARALKSRVLLYYASPLNNPTNVQTRWKAASDAALDLINSNTYELHADYHNLFIGDGNKEAIFSRFYSSDVFHYIGILLAPIGNGGVAQRNPSQNLVDAYEMTNGVIPVINGVVNPDPKNTYNPNDPYVNRDPRFYATVLYNGATFKNREIQLYKDGTDFKGNDATRTGYNLYKFLDQSLPVALIPNYNPWHYFRLAEIYLNYAEAEYNLGNEINARLYVNKVRARVGMPAITETGTALFERIVHERQVELAMEGHRYYDVRRWKIAPQTDSKPIQGTQITKNANGTFSYLRVNLLNRSWNDKLYLFPISFSEIQSSGGSLVQNPGY